MQRSLLESVKQYEPHSKNFVKSNAFYEQMNRRQRIVDVCQDFANPGEDWGDEISTYFWGRSPHFSQTILTDSFLIAHTPPSVLCYNHKVASTTWMSAFAQLLNDQEYFQKLNKTGAFYK